MDTNRHEFLYQQKETKKTKTSGSVLRPLSLRYLLFKTLENISVIRLIRGQLCPVEETFVFICVHWWLGLPYGSEVSVCWRTMETSAASMRPLVFTSSRKLD